MMPSPRLNARHIVNKYLYTLAGSLVFSLSTLAQEPAVAEKASNQVQSSSNSSEALLYPSRDMRDKTLLARAVGDQAEWLDTDYGKILALYRPTEAKITRGVLILLHAAEDPQLWLPALENLRLSLPRYGWETLAVSLPQKYPTLIPVRDSTSSSSLAATDPQPATTEAISSNGNSRTASSSASSTVARDRLIQAYINAAFAFLNNKGLFNTVILVDNSSALSALQTLLPQIRDNPKDPTTVDGPIQALVITNLQSQEPLDQDELTAVFASRQLPVLDVFFSPDDNEQTFTRGQHRAVAMRQKVNKYQQILLDPQPKSLEADYYSFLTARVRGFMQQQASGTEVKGNEGKEKPASP